MPGGQPGAEAAEELIIQYRTFKDLYLYCYHVASVVGLVCIKIFGYRDPNAEHLAERCGIAFQLTNIIRDVKEDALMGRVYLPLEDLQRFELSPADLKSGPDRARLRSLLTMEADRARDFYKSGHELIPLVNEDSQPALWVLVTIYQRLLEKIATAAVRRIRGQDSTEHLRKAVGPGEGVFQAVDMMATPWTQPPSVAVVGGGLSGLAAACALSSSGFRVTLFERRPYLGGRASSYEHPGTGEVIDNCQHVLLGCCTNLIEFYERTGVEWQHSLVRPAHVSGTGRARVGDRALEPACASAHDSRVSPGGVPPPARQNGDCARHDGFGSHDSDAIPAKRF